MSCWLSFSPDIIWYWLPTPYCLMQYNLHRSKIDSVLFSGVGGWGKDMTHIISYILSVICTFNVMLFVITSLTKAFRMFPLFLLSFKYGTNPHFTEQICLLRNGWQPYPLMCPLFCRGSQVDLERTPRMAKMEVVGPRVQMVCRDFLVPLVRRWVNSSPPGSWNHLFSYGTM